MTDLTQDWKKGKLESGFYYVYLKYLRMFDIATSSTLFGILERGNENCLEILAPVPSYEEWKELKEVADYSLHNRDDLTRQINFFMDKYTQIEKENQQLKTQIAKLTEIVGVLPLNHSVSNLGYKIKNQRHEINNRIKEIDKLKELLRECYKMLAQYHVENSKPSLDENIQLLTKIDNAIGEK